MKSCQEQPETCAVVWNNEEKLPFFHSDVNQPATLGAGALVQHLVLHSCPRKGLEGGANKCVVGRKEGVLRAPWKDSAVGRRKRMEKGDRRTQRWGGAILILISWSPVCSMKQRAGIG